jgi:hypothetical protein
MNARLMARTSAPVAAIRQAGWLGGQVQPQPGRGLAVGEHQAVIGEAARRDQGGHEPVGQLIGGAVDMLLEQLRGGPDARSSRSARRSMSPSV